MTELVRVVSLVVLFAIPVVLVYRSFLVYENQLGLIRDLDLARIQGRQWRDETRALLKGLGEAIDRQFLTWKLTEAEREVGLLLLKGLSLKEIAAVRVTSERTIRAQTRSIYAKAGLSGRAALSAFFLEDARTDRTRQLSVRRRTPRRLPARHPGCDG
jgi:DNA-binding CsgD family transcriptional regulator